MKNKKRMGHDPFDNGREISGVIQCSSIPVNEPQYNYEYQDNPLPADILLDNTNSVDPPDYRTELVDQLRLVMERIEYQQKDIDLLRAEIDELKKMSNYYLIKLNRSWLRFWFPWYGG
ncbi:MAG: hypothetical protein ABFD08_12830 [Syntrophomonas sp.]